MSTKSYRLSTIMGSASLIAMAHSAAQAQPMAVPEQVLIYTYEDGRGVERLSTSSRAKGPILSPRDVEGLTTALDAIHTSFTGDRYGMSGKAVDVEFLLAGPDRHVVIVQARPYTVEWRGDRRWLNDDGRPNMPGAR